MIVRKSWNSKKGEIVKGSLGIFPDGWVANYTYTGWFLFGIIPIYIIRE